MSYFSLWWMFHFLEYLQQAEQFIEFDLGILKDTMSLVLLQITIECKVLWWSRQEKSTEELDIWLFSIWSNLSLDRWPIRLEVSKHDLQTETCDGEGQQEKIWDIFKYLVNRINVIERRKSSRNGRRTELIVEEWYLFFVLVKNVDQVRDFSIEKNQWTKDPKRTKESTMQRINKAKNQSINESNNWKIEKLENWQNEEMKKN